MFLIGAGLGYERMLTPQIGSQLTFNYMVYDISNTDAAGSFEFKTITPELRYYFKEKTSSDKPVYVAFSAEFGQRDLDFGERDGSTTRQEVDAISEEFNPGILVGKYGKFNKGRIKCEFFIGYKHRFIVTNTVWEENNVRSTVTTSSNAPGIRIGFNYFILRF